MKLRVAAFLVAILPALAARADQVFLTEGEAPRALFGSAVTAERKAAFLAGVPLKRAGTPEEIANAIVFVSSDKSSFMTGEVLRVNGGRTAS